jgi:catechol-2,3-dioxygenase
MKDFYVNRLGLDLVSEEKGRHVFLKAGKSMLLIFNPENTRNSTNNIFPAHGAITPPSSIHSALEIRQAEYETAKSCLIQNKIVIESELGQSG